MTKLNCTPFFHLAILFVYSLLFLVPFVNLHSQTTISFDLDCDLGPGKATLEVLSPLGGTWTYALNSDNFQASNSFSDVFPGNHWLFVRNSSGDLDSIRFNANCGLEPFSCGNCLKDEGFYQVFGENGQIATLDLEQRDFEILPNSPAGVQINGMGLNPLDSLAYGMSILGPSEINELIVLDRTGRTVSLGPVPQLPNGRYAAGAFDPDGFLHVKELDPDRTLYAIDVRNATISRTYNLNATFRTADFAYNVVDNLFYGSDVNGNLFSFDPNTGTFNSIANTAVSRSFGAFYSDKTGRIWGIENSTGRLYEIDRLTGELSLIMTTTSARQNDGFACQNSFLLNLPPPQISLECSSTPDRAAIRITEPTDPNLNFRLNNDLYIANRFFPDIMPGEIRLSAEIDSFCVSDTLIFDLEPKFHNKDSLSIASCDDYVSPSGIRWTDSGNYRDTILNSMGCDSIISYDLTILESSSSSRSVVTCDTYTWNGMSLDSSGVYDFLTTNTAGCDSIARLNLEIRPFLDTQLNITSCRPINSPVGQEVFDTSGTYIDTLISALGCDSIVTVNLLIADVAAEWQLADPECPDRVVSELLIDTLTHQAPHYLIRNNRDSTLISSLPFDITDLPPGEHEIQFISADSCQSPSYTIEIEELTLPEIQLIGPSEVDICDPPSFFQVETNLSGSYQWYSSSSLLCDTCQSTEVFSFQEGPVGVEFTDDNNCTATAEIDLTVTGRDAQYFIPNVFTPNGDGINDYFTLFGKQGGVDQIELLEIYDRWGNRLFETQNIAASIESQGWNGWYRGQPMSTGVYAYRIIYQYCDGTRYRLHGTVTLAR